MHGVYKKNEKRGESCSDFVFRDGEGEEKGDNIDI